MAMRDRRRIPDCGTTCREPQSEMLLRRREGPLLGANRSAVLEDLKWKFVQSASHASRTIDFYSIFYMLTTLSRKMFRTCLLRWFPSVSSCTRRKLSSLTCRTRYFPLLRPPGEHSNASSFSLSSSEFLHLPCEKGLCCTRDVLSVTDGFGGKINSTSLFARKSSRKAPGPHVSDILSLFCFASTGQQQTPHFFTFSTRYEIAFIFALCPHNLDDSAQ